MNSLVDDANNDHAITSYGPGWIKIANNIVRRPCVVTPTAVNFDSLPSNIISFNAQNIEPIVSLSPEVVIIGTGRKQLFLDKKISLVLTKQGIGIEYMDTAAACRSFNILLSEQRSVVGIFYMIT